MIANGTLDGDPLGTMETLSYYLILATAGPDTTSYSTVAGLEALIAHPEQMRLLRERPELIPNAVEEMVRWASPVKQFTRTAGEDFDLHGTTIKAGDRVLLSFASANRDETVFPDPFCFDVTRANSNRHIAFGSGKHFCLGAPLARMQIVSLFSKLLAVIADVQVVGPIERTQGNVVTGIKHLPIRFTLHGS